jgi:hypothetical protein
MPPAGEDYTAKAQMPCRRVLSELIRKESTARSENTIKPTRLTMLRTSSPLTVKYRIANVIAHTEVMMTQFHFPSVLSR